MLTFARSEATSLSTITFVETRTDASVYWWKGLPRRVFTGTVFFVPIGFAVSLQAHYGNEQSAFIWHCASLWSGFHLVGFKGGDPPKHEASFEIALFLHGSASKTPRHTITRFHLTKQSIWVEMKGLFGSSYRSKANGIRTSVVCSEPILRLHSNLILECIQRSGHLSK